MPDRKILSAQKAFMGIQFHSSVITRVPQFPTNADLEYYWEELKISICGSSPSFYDCIKNLKYSELSLQPQKIQFTVWKYFNRAKFRATPFGRFAGVGLAALSAASSEMQLRISSTQTSHAFTNWPRDPPKSIHQLGPKELKRLELIANSSWYILHNQIRYISFFKGKYELSEVDLEATILDILQETKAKCKYTRLMELLEHKGVTRNPANEILDFMMDSGLLLSNITPSIIGSENPVESKALNELHHYVISKRKIDYLNIPKNKQKNILELIDCLHHFSPTNVLSDLNQFASMFIKKFGHTEVPLILALDPETGVDFGNFAKGNSASALPDIFGPVKHEAHKDNPVEEVIKVLLEKRINQKVVQLEKLPIDKTKPVNPLPNSFSVLLSLFGDKICIDSIGGATGNALAGRFSILGEEFTEHCQNIAGFEQTANPDVLFFDVAYQTGDKADNINRRKLCYPYALYINCYHDSNDPLMISDLLVSVQSGVIVLRSAVHKKQLIPRLASAYNYQRSDLPLFRFLCDLQHQNIQSNISFDLQDFLPDLEYYPRVQFKELWLSGAKWRLQTKKVLTGKSDEIQSLKAWIADKQVSRFVKTGTVDQTLRLDLENVTELSYLLALLKGRGTLTLTELPDHGEPPVNSDSGEPYFAQMQLCVLNHQEIYRHVSHIRPFRSSAQKFILPGQEWLYFEIFCHDNRSNELLLEIIQPWLKQSRQTISEWFFIRYKENGSHVRLRVKLIDPDLAFKLTRQLALGLQPYLTEGLVSDFLVRTYRRETERYGEDLIELVESHFHYCSQLCLLILEACFNDFQKYQIVHQLIEEITDKTAVDYDQLLELAKTSIASLSLEHKLEKSGYSKLNIAYKQFRKAERIRLDRPQERLYITQRQSLINLLNICPNDRRLQLLSDLVHMQVNRLYRSNQRSHELVLYYFFEKHLMGYLNRKIKKSAI